ncbi:unnamed protein product [Paramecium octaurelia]|uniref:Signal recognition particle 19 kDa protein n=1 Tax=Paramecium octaurelia TaxID=43137 RepID=A0A8S1VYG1_PAROT|nr:unnamed protein product [Paramecium octaurelia]
MQTPEQIKVESKTWKTIYPPYIDSTLTTAQGRRLGKTNCVPYPQLMEISQCLSSLGLRHVIDQHAGFPRDIFKQGRIKVRLYAEDKKPYNPQVQCKHTLLQSIAKLIKSIPNRKVEVPPYINQMEIEKQNKPAQKKQTSNKKKHKNG